MFDVKALPQLQTKTRVITFVSLLAIATALPAVMHSQWITGPIINTILFLSVVWLGPAEAILIGIIPSSVAMGSGLLPVALAPMVPFIMISNAVLTITFGYFKNRTFAGAVFIASAFKFFFLYSIVTLLMNTLLPGPLVAQLSIMMSWPQMYTALMGGAIAFVILKSVKKM
ncbi:ECF transporter S component [Patescibacteria group bacterium]|nr:ECF transporter S component [Patescibacteria group bacterium]